MFGKGKLTISLLWSVCLFLAAPAAAQKIVDGKETDAGQHNSAAETAPENGVIGTENVPEKSSNETAASSDQKLAAADENKIKLKSERYLLVRGEKEYVWELGSSPFNPSNFAGPKEYDVYGRDLHLTTFRFGRVIGTKGPVTYQYLFGVTPLAVFTKNEIRNPAYVSAKETPGVAPTVRKTVWGIGIEPVNFRFIFSPKRRLKPYAQVGAGIMLTSRSMPVPRSTPFNFTGEFGGGIQYFTSPTRAINIGYKYFHLSNGNIGGKINNPGYNANVFYVSYSFFHKP